MPKKVVATSATHPIPWRKRGIFGGEILKTALAALSKNITLSSKTHALVADNKQRRD